MFKFEKVYTRDNCFLIQEFWYQGFLSGVNGIPNPYVPPLIFYVNDGVVEIWENKAALQWFKNTLLKKNASTSHFFGDAIKKYNQLLRQLEVHWSRKHLSSIAELKTFIDLMAEGTKYFLIYYYSSVDQRNPKVIQYKAIKIRAADAYYDNSDKLIRNSIHHLYPHISYDAAQSITYKELEHLPSLKTLELRNRHSVFIPGSYLKAETLNNFQKKHKIYDFALDKVVHANRFPLRGAVAFQGLARGKVRVVKVKSALRMFRAGEVLVAPMTTPTYLPVMKKAAAIVTDEGGVTCHAAVVAREIKTPCVIATKIATKVLKDGDLVEVDAYRGLIYKL